MYVLVIFCYNFDTSTGYDTDNDGRLERLVCRMTRYKQESAKYRKIVAVVLILLAVLAAVWLAERWYTRHKTSAAAAGVNPIGQLLTGQPDPAEPYTGTISLVVAGYDRSAEDGEEEIGLTDMILYLQWDCDRNKLEVLQVPPSLYVGWSTGQAEAGEGEENAADPTGQGSTTGRINAVARETGGLQGLCDEITAMTGLPVDGYLGMDLNGLGDIVEYIGGVEVDIPQEIENGGSYLPKGRYLLDRNSVEFLVRERRSYAYGDMDRQRVLRSVFAGLLRYAQSCTLVDAAKLVPVIMPYMQTNLDMDTLMQLAASAESLQAEQVVFTIPSAYAVQTNSVGAIVWDPEIMAPLLRVRFGLDCDPQDLNLPAPALEASEADAGESYAYSDYIEGSVQNLSELVGGEE